MTALGKLDRVCGEVTMIRVENFEGGINTKKYMAITKVSKDTAVRDIKELVDKGCYCANRR